MTVLETERLRLRKLRLDDGEFIIALLNDPAFIRNIGDKHVRTAADAEKYLTSGPLASYASHGFGLYLVALKQAGTPIGICGLIKRDTLEDVDIGFAFLPEYGSRGYAEESARAVKTYARDVVGLKRLVAITVPDNQGSIRVLEKIGLVFEKRIRLNSEELMLFAASL